jgi:hypothetical protein
MAHAFPFSAPNLDTFNGNAQQWTAAIPNDFPNAVQLQDIGRIYLSNNPITEQVESLNRLGFVVGPNHAIEHIVSIVVPSYS